MYHLFIQYNMEKSMFEQELQRIRMENKKDNCDVRFRIEQAIKDQNDKLDAILNHFGLKLEKVKPETINYKVSEKKDLLAACISFRDEWQIDELNELICELRA